jgi:type IX secretion system PorP/SprF family membrane protein
MNTHEQGHVTVLYNKMFSAVPGSPQTTVLNIAMPVPSKNTGYGLYYMRERVGFSEMHNAYATYAYSFPIAGTTNLNLGVSVGALSQNFDMSKAVYISGNDPIIKSLLLTPPITRADLRASAFVNGENWFAGAAISRLTKPRFDYVYYNYTASYNMQSQASLMFGYNIDLGDDVLLKPSGCVMFDNYGVVNSNILATSYFANKYVMSNGNVYSNKNNSFFSFSNFTFNYSSVSALPTVNALLPIDYTFFNSISQIKYNAKYNGAVLLDSYFVFYLDSSNNYHMCAQYPKTENKNVLLFSDSACDNFPNTGNFGNTLGTVNPDPTVTTIVAVSGNAASATVTTSTVSATGTPSVSGRKRVNCLRSRCLIIKKYIYQFLTSD